ncbi:MAG: trypsin-like serine protease [Phycisphaerales bacterium]
MSRPSIAVPVVCVLLSGAAASASLVRDDVSEAASTSLGANPAFATVRFSINGGVGSGTLVAPGWVLTAAHVVTDNTGAPLPLSSIGLSVNGESRGVAEVVARPGWTGSNYTAGMDLALVRLSSPFSSLTPASMNFGAAPVGVQGTIAGYGAFGFGSAGFVAPPGNLRGATNTLDAIGSTAFASWSSSLMLMDFDSPTTAGYNRLGTADATAMEGVPATGDSGGGTFVQIDGVWMLTGVHSFTFTNGAVAAPGGYGTCAADVLVSSASGWIQSAIPVPGASALLAGAMMLAARRTRK